jgi:ABC-2 type transport system permease protein
MTSFPASLPRPRALGSVNGLGLWTLIDKEIWRFLNISAQTIMAPVIMTLLFFAVFAFSTDGQRSVEGIPYLAFLAPGLVMMSMAQNAFFNSATSLVLSKLQGNIVDILMAPLSPFELTIGYTMGGVVRGVLVGIVTIACLVFFIDIKVHSLFFILYYAVTGSMMMTLIGVITGIWADKFDHMATVQNFIVLPATFLSGTFYSIDHLPESFRFFCNINPFFYMIDGFRYGFIGVADGSLPIGLAFVFVVNLGLLGVAYCLFEKGYKLKA